MTRKVTDGVARIKLGLLDKLSLGNIDAKRDWGHARDYVRAMWLMLQQDRPDDYVIATGRTTSVRDMVGIAFAHVGLDPDDHIVIDPRSVGRPKSTSCSAMPTRPRQKLGWTPTISLEEMIAEMVDVELERHRASGR